MLYGIKTLDVTCLEEIQVINGKYLCHYVYPERNNSNVDIGYMKTITFHVNLSDPNNSLKFCVTNWSGIGMSYIFKEDNLSFEKAIEVYNSLNQNTQNVETPVIKENRLKK